MFERELFRLVVARTEAERPGNAVGAIVGAAKNVTARTAVTRAVRDMAAPPSVVEWRKCTPNRVPDRSSEARADIRTLGVGPGVV